jgi:threonine/homoserine/homoserine lactone efflux protein
MTAVPCPPFPRRSPSRHPCVFDGHRRTHTIFYSAVLPQFVDPARSALRQFTVLASTFTVLELCMTLGVTFGAHTLAPVLGQKALARMTNVGGAIMVGAALLLAVAPVGH